MEGTCWAPPPEVKVRFSIISIIEIRDLIRGFSRQSTGIFCSVVFYSMAHKRMWLEASLVTSLPRVFTFPQSFTEILLDLMEILVTLKLSTHFTVGFYSLKKDISFQQNRIIDFIFCSKVAIFLSGELSEYCTRNLLFGFLLFFTVPKISELNGLDVNLHR
jgi:hypothetical protein